MGQWRVLQAVQEMDPKENELRLDPTKTDGQARGVGG